MTSPAYASINFSVNESWTDEVSLDESTVIPSRRDFLSRKIQKLKAGDFASLPSILVDLTY